MPRHLLHGGLVNAEVEQVPDPGPAQIVRAGAWIWAWRPLSRQVRQAPPGAEAGQLIAVRHPGQESATQSLNQTAEQRRRH
jgi:hypothetical protein